MEAFPNFDWCIIYGLSWAQGTLWWRLISLLPWLLQSTLHGSAFKNHLEASIDTDCNTPSAPWQPSVGTCNTYFVSPALVTYWLPSAIKSTSVITQEALCLSTKPHARLQFPNDVGPNVAIMWKQVIDSSTLWEGQGEGWSFSIAFWWLHPALWNGLSSEVRLVPTLASFQKMFKIELFYWMFALWCYDAFLIGLPYALRFEFLLLLSTVCL